MLRRTSSSNMTVSSGVRAREPFGRFPAFTVFDANAGAPAGLRSAIRSGASARSINILDPGRV
jgi:hypothetical protein